VYKLNVVTKPGKVWEFDKELLTGTVMVDGTTDKLQFSPLCFHSELPFRYPITGESVRVTLSTDTGNVVLVRGGIQ
jgi:hypothetical protein